MEFTVSLTYPGSIDEVVAMSVDPSYMEARFGDYIIPDSVQISSDAPLRITYSAQVRSDLIPAAAARFVKTEVAVTVTEEWVKDEAGASARTTVSVEGVPVSVEASSQLVPTDDGCQRNVRGEMNVRIPLLGGRIEKEAVARISRLTSREAEVGANWLGEHRA